MSLELQLLSGSWPDEPGLDTALSKVILDRVSAGDMMSTMRLYVPGREVAFGKRDTVAPQYRAAVDAAREVGFVPVERLAGGRAAVFTEHTIAFSLALEVDDPRSDIHDRFRAISEMVVTAFAAVGVDSTVGEVPGEYCPGEFSVNHGGRLKLMGVGQRLARNAAHVGGVIAVAGTELMLTALIPVYRALELEWRPHTTGSLTDINPGVSTEQVLIALRSELGAQYRLHRGRISDQLVADARELAPRYVPETN